MPSSGSTPTFPVGTDKVVHGIMYLTLAACLVPELGRKQASAPLANRLFTAQCVWVLASAYGGLIELLQMWMGLGRSAEWGDLVADVIGAAIGAVLGLYIQSRLGRRQS